MRTCLAIREKAMPDDWRRFWAMSLLGGSLRDQGKYVEAEPLLVAGYEGIKARESKMPSAGKPRLLDAARGVVRLYKAWDKPELARSWSEKISPAALPADVFAEP